MTRGFSVCVEGIGVWAPDLPDWRSLRAQLRGETLDAEPQTQPRANLLPAGDRRRAPISVRLAIEAADQAVQMSARAADTLPSIFTSMHGDAAIMDYMCATLAHAPREMSPTRFHNSVHNAAAGYWTIVTGCRQASNAVCAGRYSFGAGLLEAVTLAMHDACAVLLVAFDAPGSGPLAEVLDTHTPLGCALVLAPTATAATRAGLTLEPCAQGESRTPVDRSLARLAADNACGDALALLEALAGPSGSSTYIASGPALGLRVVTESMT
jgi:hypothetical protein